MENPMFSWKSRGSLEKPGFSKIEGNPRFSFFHRSPHRYCKRKVTWTNFVLVCVPGLRNHIESSVEGYIGKKESCSVAIPPTKVLFSGLLSSNQVAGCHKFAITRLQVSLHHSFGGVYSWYMPAETRISANKIFILLNTCGQRGKCSSSSFGAV